MLADAARRGLEVTVRERAPAGSLAEAAAILGVAPGAIAKSLVVRRHDGSYLFALIPGGRKISWAKLRAVVGVNRLALPSPELAREATGFERGTITPLGSLSPWPVYADAPLGALDPETEVVLGAGAHGYSAIVRVGALLGALDAVVADIGEDAAP